MFRTSFAGALRPRSLSPCPPIAPTGSAAPRALGFASIVIGLLFTSSVARAESTTSTSPDAKVPSVDANPVPTATLAPGPATPPPAPAPSPAAPPPGPEVAAVPTPTELTDELEASEIIVIEDRAPAESASSVHFNAKDLQRRPHAQPSDLLRQTPGLVVAQHAGGGKSDQYFLRGFDADHGTDVAVFVDGIPVNLTSHGHGHGYADTHWIIPETIASLDVHKGPYAARFGDFYTAGALELTTVDVAPGATVWLTGGTELTGPLALERPTYRTVGMANPDIGDGSALLAAELGHTEGPFLDGQEFRRGTLLAKWSAPIGPGRLGVAATSYAARWNQSGQLPAREVEAGRLDRFGSLDPTEGGASSRSSLSLHYTVDDSRGARWRLRGYAVGYRMRLFSNFTLFLRDPDHGDQIEQTDDRLLYGLSGDYQRRVTWRSVDALIRAGVDARADDVTADLWHTSARIRLSDCFEVANPCNRVDQRIRNLAAYIEADVAVADRLHLVPGLRLDQFVWDVEDLDPETALSPDTTGGTAQRAIASPKLSAVMHATKDVDVFANGGFGFHSNDARAAVASRGKEALARAIGAETGARIHISGLRASAALWYLYLSSEQVWSGDAGGTEASDPTQRYGVDVDATWSPTGWLDLDGNVALARSTFVANRGNAGALALAPRITGSGGVTAHRGDSFVALRGRGIGDRPANDDGTLTAEGSLVLDLVAGHRLGRFGLGLTVTNLLNAEWREAQFAETSRIAPGADEIEDVHFTPGAPLTALVTVSATL